MSESTADFAAAPAPAQSSFWEDLFDIFYKPSAVFQRRQGKSPWPPLLFVTIVVAVIAFATFNTMEPIIDAEFTRATAKAVQQNPQAAQAMEKMRSVSMTIGKFIVGPMTLLSMFVVGVVAWILGKLFGSTQKFEDAISVAGWAFMPRVLGSILGAVQALLMDPAKLTSAQAITLSPARFLSPETTNPLVFQLLGRFDLMILWQTVLLAIGLRITGKVGKTGAIVFGVLIWLLGALPVIRSAMAQM